MNKPIRKASTVEVIAIHDLLKKHIVMLDAVDRNDQRLVRYIEGFDDAKVASMVADDLPSSIVGRVRREMFGSIIGAAEKTHNCEKFESRLSRLEDRVALIREAIKTLAEKLGEQVSL